MLWTQTWGFGFNCCSVTVFVRRPLDVCPLATVSSNLRPSPLLSWSSGQAPPGPACLSRNPHFLLLTSFTSFTSLHPSGTFLRLRDPPFSFFLVSALGFATGTTRTKKAYKHDEKPKQVTHPSPNLDNKLGKKEMIFSTAADF